MKICSRNYTGRSGIYAKAMPDYNTSMEMHHLIVHSDPPFCVDWFVNQSHISLILSDIPPLDTRLRIKSKPIVVHLDHAEYWAGGNNSGFAVLVLKPNSKLSHLHQLFISLGAKQKYPTYNPHITIGMNVGPDSQQMQEWLIRMNELITVRNPTLFFNRIRIQDLLF